jgi:ribokinase
MGKIVVAGSLHYDIMLDAHHRPEKGETVMGTGCAYKFGGKGAIKPYPLLVREGTSFLLVR